jgi:hypothetical protein
VHHESTAGLGSQPMVEAELKKNPPPAPKVEAKKEEKSLVKGAKLEPLVVDPVDEALKKYAIITENPWEPGKKYAPCPHPSPTTLYSPHLKAPQ